MSIGFEVERIDGVSPIGSDELTSKNLMSPFVWQRRRKARPGAYRFDPATGECE